ncbi:single-stranded DNA-binding protein [Solimicrobium silvestre]|uniref:Single-stranded DNA-binding protein n=1 Tax=Solimicrobium silvestre TaxID=2099400 RepID=A0A2S9GTJ4_9BURK|nr:single-stranded DNA-binding protein [Solimicrobium silvestre]PRC91037.1 hypothetical protein S2091_4225 [Solimicrobium silvestre]
MAEPATATQSSNSKIGFMQVAVKGRIESSSSYEGKRATKIMTPAADEYSRPQILEVRSKNRLGENGDLVTLRCTLGGYQRKAYQAKDKESGEIKTVVPVDHTLDVIED